MSAVTVQEIVDILNDISLSLTVAGHSNVSAFLDAFCSRIESHGIAPPDGFRIVSKIEYQDLIGLQNLRKAMRPLFAAAPEVKP